MSVETIIDGEEDIATETGCVPIFIMSTDSHFKEVAAVEHIHFKFGLMVESSTGDVRPDIIGGEFCNGDNIPYYVLCFFEKIFNLPDSFFAFSLFHFWIYYVI